MLTQRQKQIYEFIKQSIKENGYAPSLEEIKKNFKLKSVSTVHEHIETLRAKGFLNKAEHQARAISIFDSEPMIQINILGNIAAGQPIEAMQYNTKIAIPRTKLPVSGEFYGLRVVGDSMIDENINDGDTVIIKSQPTASNGEKVVCLINNNEATLKKFYKEKNKIRLQPANREMKPIYVELKNLIVQGVVIDIIKNLKPETKVIKNITKNPKRNDILENVFEKWLNTTQCMDCVEGMKQIPDNSIDLVVTSPPYDEIRKYNGFSYDLHATGKEIFRILKDGGIAAMVIQDQTKNFAKSLTSFKTIIDWCDNIGLRLFETVIYRKHGTEGAWWKHRFRVDHEYIPIFLKGAKPQYFNKEPLKIPSKHGGKVMTGSGNRKTNGETTKTVTRLINPTKCRGTIWNYLMAGDKNPLKRKHPAVFPDKIPFDFIQCFCPPDGIVLDPFMGCGSTAVTAKQLKRNYIGFDISQEYCDLTKERINTIQDTLL